MRSASAGESRPVDEAAEQEVGGDGRQGVAGDECRRPGADAVEREAGREGDRAAGDERRPDDDEDDERVRELCDPAVRCEQPDGGREGDDGRDGADEDEQPGEVGDARAVDAQGCDPQDRLRWREPDGRAPSTGTSVKAR